MSVAEQNNAQIERLKGLIKDSFTACSEKDATMPSTELFANLPGTIRSIQTGVPDGYINLADVINHCTQSDSGTFTGSGQTCEKLSIGLSFRPKIILVAATTPITTSNTGSPYEICAVWRVYNDDFDVLRDNCVFVYKSGSSAKSGHTVSNGLRGNANNTITGWGTSAKFASGVTYSWYAWG